MAIKYKDIVAEFKKINDNLEKAPLTIQELDMVTHVEEYIDKIITQRFTGNQIMIELAIPNFTYDIVTMSMSDLPKARQNLMRKELDKRYKQAGWEISIKIDDGLDGPNMYGSDYWVLKGKK